jgi:hypothetical protein
MVPREKREQARREQAARIPEHPALARLIIWFQADEFAALRLRAAKEKRSESALVREGVRRLLGLEGQGR